MMEFKSFPKIPRCGNEKWTITEKIDGTNACVIITEDGQIGAQSRTRIITTENDNYGFAKWVSDHSEELLLLGPGYHYGEWWGAGIQRKYNETEKVFSLFSWWRKPEETPLCCRLVPIVANTLEESLERLKREGSIASPGFDRPEGLILQNGYYHHVYYKFILDK